MATIVGSASIRIFPNTTGFNATLQGQLKGANTAIQNSLGKGGAGGAVTALRTNLQGLSEDLGRSSQRMINAGEGMTYALTRPLVGLAKTILETATEYDKFLRTAAAVTVDFQGNAPEDLAAFNASATETYQQLSKKAIEFSRSTSFSMNEVASAFVEVGRAGIQGEDKISAVFKTIANVAMVEGEDITKVTEGLIKVFTGFGGSFEYKPGATTIFGGPREDVKQLEAEFSKMGDVLALVSARTTTNISDLVNAFRYAGPVAAAVGLSFEETASGLGLLAQAGFDATVGGTALRGIITRLIIPTQVNQEVFDKLGVTVNDVAREIEGEGDTVEEITAIHKKYGLEVLDNAGKMKPLTEILRYLDDQGISTAEAMKLFGQRAGPGLLALIGQSPELLEDMTKEMGKAGGATEAMAEILKGSWDFQFKQFRNSLIELGNAIAASGFMEFVVDITHGLTDFLRHMAETSPETFRFVLAIGALVAAVGPLNIVLGLLGKAWNNALLKPMIMLTHPVGAVALALGAVAGAIGFAASQSEELRTALGHLFKSLSVAALPVLDILKNVIGAIGAGVLELGRMFGDWLAPKIRDVAEAINGWVTGSGMNTFIDWFYNGVKNLVVVVHDLKTEFDEFVQSEDFQNLLGNIASGFENLGSAIEYVEDNVGKFREQFAVALEILGKAGAILGGAIYTGLRIVAGLFEQVTKLAKPLVEFLGDGGLAGVLLLLGARFLSFGGQAATGAALGAGALGMFFQAGLSPKFIGVGIALDTLGTKISNLGARAPQLGALSSGLSTLGAAATRTGSFLLNAGTLFEMFAAKIATAGSWIKSTITNAIQPALMGFFAGQLLQKADTMASKITAVGMAVSALLMSVATGNAFIIILTAVTVAIGAFLKEGDDIPRMTAGVESSMQNLMGTLTELDGKFTKSSMLRDFIEELDKVDQNAFVNVNATLELMGTSMEEWTAKMMEGSDASKEFVDNLSKSFLDGTLTGEFKNFRIEVGRLNEAGNFDRWEQVTDKSVFEQVSKDVRTAAQNFRVLDVAADDSTSGLKDFDEVMAELQKRSDSFLGFNAMRDIAASIDPTIEKWKLIEHQINAVTDAQEKTAEGAKTWVQSASEANAQLSESKRLLDLISGEGLADPQARLEDLVLALRDSADELKLAGATDFKLKDGLDEASIAANRKIREVGGEFRSYIAEVMADVPVGINETETKKNVADAVGWAKLAFAGEMANTLGISMEQALASLDTSDIGIDTEMAIKRANVQELIVSQMKTQDSGKASLAGVGPEGERRLPIILGLDFDMSKVGEIFGKAGSTPAKFADFLLGTDPIFRDIAMNLVNGEVDNPQQQSTLIKLLSSDGMISKDVQAKFAMVMGNMPEGWNSDMVMTALQRGASVSEIYSKLIVKPQLEALPGMTPEFMSGFLDKVSRGEASLGSIGAFVNIFGQLQPGSLDPTVFGNLLSRWASMGATDNVGMQDQVNLLAKWSDENPAEMTRIAELLAGQSIPEMYLPIALQLSMNGVDLDDFSKEELELMLQYAMAPSFVMHTGGIVGQTDSTPRMPLLSNEVSAVLEIGEAVIPKGVVDALGPDYFKQLITGAVPTALLNVDIQLSVHLLGGDLVAAGFQAMMAIISGLIAGAYASMITLFAAAGDSFNSTLARMSGAFGGFRAIIAVGSMLVVQNINSIGDALKRIPGIMEGVSRSIAYGFRHPIAFIGERVWPPFAAMLNSAAGAFGVTANIPGGFSVPMFHSGGVVGQGGSKYTGGALSNDELFALLQQGEGVMSQEMMANLTKDQMAEFKRGNPMWFAVGGPYESGKSYVSSNKDKVGDSIKEHDLEAMKATYNDTVVPMLNALKSQFGGNVAADVGSAAIEHIANGAFDWVKGGNEAVAEELESRMVSIGLPPGFNLEGAVPEGFDIAHWRSFLGANKRPGSYPLLMSYLQAAGVPYLVNSTFRPGGTSYHAQSRAVDFGAPNDSNYDSPGLLRINRALAPMLGVLQELIYSGPGGVSDKAYDAGTMAQHHNHVHAALANGGYIQDMIYTMLGEAGPEVVLPLSDPGRALDIALASDLFSVLAAGQRSRMGANGMSSPAASGASTALRSVPTNQSVPSGNFDGGFLGGGPGNTYNIYGIDEAHVRTTIRNQDEAVQRKRN